MKTENLNPKSGLLVLLSVVAAVFLSVSCSSKEDPSAMAKPDVRPQPDPQSYSVMDNGDTTWVVVDKLPEYEGGEAAMLKYLTETVKYPDVSKKDGTQGRVIVRFRINKNGLVDNVSVLKGVSPEIDTESMKVVQSLPAFKKPAMKNGKPVAVWYMVPLTFTLR